MTVFVHDNDKLMVYGVDLELIGPKGDVVTTTLTVVAESESEAEQFACDIYDGKADEYYDLTTKRLDALGAPPLEMPALSDERLMAGAVVATSDTFGVTRDEARKALEKNRERHLRVAAVLYTTLTRLDMLNAGGTDAQNSEE